MTVIKSPSHSLNSRLLRLPTTLADTSMSKFSGLMSLSQTKWPSCGRCVFSLLGSMVLDLRHLVRLSPCFFTNFLLLSHCLSLFGFFWLKKWLDIYGETTEDQPPTSPPFHPISRPAWPPADGKSAVHVGKQSCRSAHTIRSTIRSKATAAFFNPLQEISAKLALEHFLTLFCSLWIFPRTSWEIGAASTLCKTGMHS